MAGQRKLSETVTIRALQAADLQEAAVRAEADARLTPQTRTVNGKPLSADVTLGKSDVGLANVDNTADAAKPISTAQQAGLDGKFDKTGGTVMGSITQSGNGTTFSFIDSGGPPNRKRTSLTSYQGDFYIQQRNDDLTVKRNAFIISNETGNVTLSSGMFFNGDLVPSIDNARSLGGPGARMTTIYSATGAINTSDAREKTPLLEPDQNFFDAILKVPMGHYQWKDALAKKGAVAARVHYGPTAQGVRDALLAAGFDPNRYALFCEDVLPDAEGHPRTERLGLRLDQFDRYRTEAVRRALLASYSR